MSQSPGVEYAKQEIQRRVEKTQEVLRLERRLQTPEQLSLSILDSRSFHVIEYFAEHLDEIYGKFEQQRVYNRQLEERIRSLENDIYRLHNPNP